MLQQGLVVFAKNKKRVSAFYQQTLGLKVEGSDTSHDLLRGNGYEVVVHSIPRKYAAGIAIAKPPQPRDETPFKPTFVVASLTEVRRAVEALVATSSLSQALGTFAATQSWTVGILRETSCSSSNPSSTRRVAQHCLLHGAA